MTAIQSRDFFDRARTWAAALMALAGLAAVLGSTLDWVTITLRPELREDTRFEDESALEEPKVSDPFTGLDAGDGWWSLAGGVVLVLSALLLLLRKKALWAWVGLLGAVLVGAIALADYRGIGDLSSSLSHRMNIVGGAEPGVGITMVAAAALAGLLGSVGGIAASPDRAQNLGSRSFTSST
jgi:LPXTG-motif cell wall-anchored protein